MKKTPPILPTYYKSLGTKIFRDTTALPFADGGPLNDRNIKGDLLPSVYASALGNYYSNGGKFFTTGNEYHRVYKNAEGNIMVNHPKEDKGKWDTINLTEKSGANTISEGVDATKQWHAENPNTYANGGMIKRADGSYSKRGLWDNIRANAGSGKEPTKEMLAQERKINNSYADGGELGPGDPPNWKRPNLSPERIAALKALHGDNIFGNVNPNDLLLYDLNKDLVDNATEFKSFLDPTAEIGDRYDNEALTTDLKNRMVKQGYGLDTKTGNYFRIPDEVLKAIQEPEDDFIPIKPPGRIDIPKRDIIRFDNSTTPAPEYDAPGYYRDYPAITWQHHNANQLIPHARPHLTEVRVPGLGAAVIQKITGYNKPAIEGYEDEEGNWIPGEIEKAQEEGRRINFQGANSLEDRRAQKEYNALYDAYEKERQLKGMYPTYIPTKEHAQGGQLKPDYSLPEDSFQQGGRGLKNSVYASSMGQYPANYAEGGAMNQDPPGGPIYTYKGRPGSYYQKDSKGKWYISNKGTGGNYIPIDDPSGQRTAVLNKSAVVAMANPTAPKQDYSKVTPSYSKSGMVQSVAGRTEAERQPVKNEIEGQQFAQKMEQDYATATKNGLPQHEQPLDMMNWAWQAAAGLPTGLKAIGQLAALQIPYTGLTVGTVANTAGAIHGATQIPDRIGDWENVMAGKMDYRDALLNTGLTAAEFLGTKSAYDDLTKAGSKIVTPLKTAETIIPTTAPKKVVGTLDEFGDVVETSKVAPKVTVYGESVPITKPKSGVDFTSTEFNPQAPASSLQEWQDAKKYAQQANQRFINSRSEQDFLVSKYKDEYAKEFGVSPEDLDYKDVLLYGKLKEAAQLPVRHTAPLDTRMLGPKSTDIHESFISSENPRFDLNPEQELVIDSYARGYDDLINQRNSFAGGAFYENKVAPILEQSILQNQFKNAQNLIRGSEDFPIQGMASVMRNGKRVDGIKFSELQEGDTFIPGSFISTSITKPNAAIAGGLDIPSTGFTGKKGNLDYIIKAPEGQSYLYPNSTVIQQFPGEMEAILPKNLKLNLDKIVSDTERGYLNSIKDVKRGEIYKGGILNLEHSPSFTKRPNKYFPFIPQLDKIVDLKGNVVPKSSYQQILDYHNATHQPTIPKYYFSILNPYLFGGKLK